MRVVAAFAEINSSLKQFIAVAVVPLLKDGDSESKGGRQDVPTATDSGSFCFTWRVTIHPL
eukprot:7239197-Ditylum_brightwellii.AAC.1